MALSRSPRSGSVNTSVQGDYTLLFCIDQAGNEADPVTRTVKVESFDANLGLLTFAIKRRMIACHSLAAMSVPPEEGEIPAVWDGKPVTGIEKVPLPGVRKLRVSCCQKASTP